MLCRKRRNPVDKTWFSNTPTERNAAEMFFTFFNLAAWIISEYGQVKVSPLKEGEDSAAAVRNLLQAMKQLNFIIPQTVTASRLQSGRGQEICGILNALVDWALESTLFQFKAPQHVTEQDDRCAPERLQAAMFVLGRRCGAACGCQILVEGNWVMCSNIDVLEANLEADMLSQTGPGLMKVPGAAAENDLANLAPSGSKPQSMSRPGTAHCGGDGFIIENRVCSFRACCA